MLTPRQREALRRANLPGQGKHRHSDPSRTTCRMCRAAIPPGRANRRCETCNKPMVTPVAEMLAALLTPEPVS